MRLKNKICLVTAAARGIGAATCAKFAAEGGIVIGAAVIEVSGGVSV